MPRGGRSTGLRRRRAQRQRTPASLRAYSQGDGASFVPDSPFDAGERVDRARRDRRTLGRRRQAQASRLSVPRRHAISDGEHARSSPTRRRRPPTTRASTPCPASQAPVLTVTVPDRDPAAGDILTTNGPGPGQYGPLIYTPDGRLVWFDRLAGRRRRRRTSTSRPTKASAILTWWRGRVLSLGFGQGEDLVMNSRYQTVARVAGGNGLQADLHDFQIAPHDVAYITAFNPIRCDLTSVKGARDGAIIDTAIQEIDIKTGLVRWEWHSLDHVGASESEVEAPTGRARGTTSTSTRSTPSRTATSSSRRAAPGPATSSRAAAAGSSGASAATRSSFKMGPGTRTAWQHDGRCPPQRRGHLLRRRLEPADPPAVARGCGSRSTSRPTKRAWRRPTRTPTRRCSPRARATCRRWRTGTRVVGYGGVPAISEYARRRRAALRRPPAVRHVLLPRLPLPLERAPAEPARGPRQPATTPAKRRSCTRAGTARPESPPGACSPAPHAGSLTVSGPTIPAGGFESSTILPERLRLRRGAGARLAGHVLGSLQRRLTRSATRPRSRAPDSRDEGDRPLPRRPRDR